MTVVAAVPAGSRCTGSDLMDMSMLTAEGYDSSISESSSGFLPDWPSALVNFICEKDNVSRRTGYQMER